MSVFVLKTIAMLSMIIDHVAYVASLAWQQSGPALNSMRAVGRIAFPIFAFLIVNGFEKSSDRLRYLSRLSLFALISQIPFSLAFTFDNYADATQRVGESFIKFDCANSTRLLLAAVALVFYLFALRKERKSRFFWYIPATLVLPFILWEMGGVTVLGATLNIFYTLSVCLAVICAVDCLLHRNSGLSAAELVSIAAAAAAAAAYILPQSDYNFKALMLIVPLYLCKNSRVMQAVLTALWLYMMYYYSIRFLFFALGACILILLYNGKQGKPMKLFFYIVYPVHVLVLFLLGFFMS